MWKWPSENMRYTDAHINVCKKKCKKEKLKKEQNFGVEVRMQMTKPVARKCSVKNMFLKISQNSQENMYMVKKLVKVLIIK